MSDGLILFAHGARDPEWAAPVRRVQTAIRQRAPSLRVELAFLEFMAPDLAACGADLVAAGCRDIAILPMFIAQGGHLKREVPELVAALAAAHPAARFTLRPPVGEAEAVIAAMADHALALVSV